VAGGRYAPAVMAALDSENVSGSES
jgi:hypothetical protein